MKKVMIFITLFLLLSINIIFGKQIVISVSDFTVESKNPSHEFIGKGISRLVAGELRKSNQINLIEREQLNRLLEEQEFSLSDLADQKKQIQLGLMLSAQYIVLGEIIDMGNTLLLSLRMANVETGEVVWAEEIMEKLETYDYIGAYFAKSILTELGTGVEETIVEKIEKKEEKIEEAIVKLSKGIDAYDKKDITIAKKALEEAKKIDPTNEVVQIYLNKLVLNASKFKTITEKYLPNQNPAYLGIIQYDRFYFSTASGILLDKSSIEYWGETLILESNPDIGIVEFDYITSIGYQFPFGNDFGFGLFIFHYSSQNEMLGIGDENWHDDINEYTSGGLGSKITFGWAPADIFALGLGVSLYWNNRSATLLNPLYPLPGEESLEKSEQGFIIPAFTLGLLFKNQDSTRIYDIYGGFSLEKSIYIDPDNFPIYAGDEREIMAPLFIENTFTFAFNQRNTFFVLKQLNDIYLDIGHYYGRLMPALEHWFVNWLSMRIGVEGSLMKIDSNVDFGIGGTGGISIRIPAWGLDFDINVTYRRRPSRIVAGELLNEIIPLIIITKTNTFLSR